MKSLWRNVYVPPLIVEGGRILCVGDYPDEEDEDAREPFAGRIGEKLCAVFRLHGIARSQISFTNICHFRPQYTKGFKVENSYEWTEGQAELADLIATSKPSVIVALGGSALEFLTGKYSIAKYRGSILPCSLPGLETFKVIPTFHPRYLLANAGDYPIFAADIERIVGDSEFRELRYVPREYVIAPTGTKLDQFVEYVENLEDFQKIACDIEAIKGKLDILCHAFAISPTYCVVLPHEPGYFPYIERLYKARCKKIFHYGPYDYNMLTSNGFDVVNYTEDTFFQFHCIEPELPRGLDFLTSIFTREPYYKSEGRADIPDDTKVWSERVDRDKLYIYNAKDGCVTYEIHDKLTEILKADEDRMRSYQFRIAMNPIALQIGRNGMYVDQAQNEKLKMALVQRWAKLQAILNTIVGKPLNVNSPVAVKNFLYKTIKLPERKARNNKGEWKVSSGEDAIVACITYCKGYVDNLKTAASKAEWQLKGEACKLILEIRGLRKLISSYVSIILSADGTAKSIYIAHAGTDTSRWSCSKFLANEGVNAQTFPRDAIEVPDVMDPNFNIFDWVKLLDETDNQEETDEQDGDL